MAKTSTNSINFIEMQEVIQKLRDSGHSDLIDCLLENEKECYTKKGRLNKSKTCRKLNKKSKWLEDTLRDMREILKKDFDIEEEQGA